jgi:hypothetical protein
LPTTKQYISFEFKILSFYNTFYLIIILKCL